jgi:myo-inositol-1-phosphate synthase
MNGRVGVWIVGALGNVGACTVLGARAAARGLARSTGLVSELPEFRGLPLVPLSDLVFGGHEIRHSDLAAEALEFHRQNGVPSRDLIDALKVDLLKASENIRDGLLLNCGKPVAALANGRWSRGSKRRLPLAEAVRAIQQDLASFARRHALRDVIVVNLASCEKPVDSRALGSLRAMREAIRRDRREHLSASVLYAYAAIDAGRPYINFAASLGSSVPAIEELALERGVPHMGKDAKTGETLLKTTLAPMFAMRNLDVLSWEGHNLLGNRDGLVLDDPENARLKLADKRGVLESILKKKGFHTRVRIDYVPDLQDWKTAWNHIRFEGFLGARMTMQVIWQGCDSLLAAPLVLDLVRFAELAHRNGEAGPLKHLSCFFKNPLGVRDHHMFRQFRRLVRYARRLLPEPQPAGR